MRRHTACRGGCRSWRRARPGVGLLAAIVRLEVWRVLARVRGEDLGQLEGHEAAVERVELAVRLVRVRVRVRVTLTLALTQP